MSENIREDAVPQALRKSLLGFGIGDVDGDYDDIASDFVEAYYEYIDTHEPSDNGEA